MTIYNHVMLKDYDVDISFPKCKEDGSAKYFFFNEYAYEIYNCAKFYLKQKKHIFSFGYYYCY